MKGINVGNKNAEIWNEEKTLELYNKALELCKRKTEYTVNGKEVQGYEFDFIGELADELDNIFKENIYRKLIDSHLPNRFESAKKFFEQIKNKLETNCYSNTKKGIINTATGIVNLKSNHGWTDRVENRNENTNIDKPTPRISFDD